MEYLNYVMEIIQDVYDSIYCKYLDYKYLNYDYNLNDKLFIKDEYHANDDEIQKIIEDAKTEIRIDKEIKDLEQRYEKLCKEVNQNNDTDSGNNNNNHNNDDGAIKLKNKKATKISY